MNSEVKLALRAGLAQHERSLVQFSVQVASLCEKHGAEATQKACRLLLSEIQPIRSDGDVGLVDREAPASPRQATRLDVVRHDLEVSGVRPLPSISQETAGDFDHQVSVGSVSEKGPSQFGATKVPLHVMMDARLKILEFIDPVSGVEDPLPNLVYLLGPRGLSLYNAFTRIIQAWRPMDNSFSHFARSAAFQCLCALVIVANFVLIAVKANWHASHIGQDDPTEFTVLASCFTAFYTVELAINLAVHGGTFWTCDDWGWNLFDFGIVSMSLIETVITASGGAFVDASFLRMLRFARISRVLRMFSAVRMFKEIRIMVDALVGSFSICLWITALFVLMLALFAIFLVQGYASHIETRPSGDNDLLKEYFGSVSDAMMSLFMCATGGSDWKPYYVEAAKMGDHFQAFILLFIGFYHFSFYNVVTSVFCEKALHLAKPTLEELLSERYQKEFNDARELYHLLDTHLEGDDGNSTQSGEIGTKSTWHNIDAEQFENFIDDPTVERFFEVRGLGPCSARRFFRMLCELNGTHHVDFPTFVSACIKLDGTASSCDLHVMSVRQLFGMHQLQAIQEKTHAELQNTQRQIVEDLAGLLNGKIATLQQNWREGSQMIATSKTIMSSPSTNMPRTPGLTQLEAVPSPPETLPARLEYHRSPKIDRTRLDHC